MLLTPSKNRVVNKVGVNCFASEIKQALIKAAKTHVIHQKNYSDVTKQKQIPVQVYFNTCQIQIDIVR